MACTYRSMGRRPGCEVDTQADVDQLILDVGAIQDVTDNLPDNGALTSIAQATMLGAVKTVTDQLPNGGALTTINTAVGKIDGASTSGLTGTSNSLAYRVHEIERHFHGRERWFGKKSVQTATDWADNNISTPYRAISGNNDYGGDANDEAQVVGTDDTPAISGNVRYDVHRILVVDSNSTSIWKLRLVYGTGTLADAITAGQYSTFMVKIDAAAGQTPNVPCEVMMPRGTCGSTKVWLQGWNATNNATIDFYVGWHEYEG